MEQEKKEGTTIQLPPQKKWVRIVGLTLRAIGIIGFISFVVIFIYYVATAQASSIRGFFGEVLLISFVLFFPIFLPSSASFLLGHSILNRKRILFILSIGVISFYILICVSPFFGSGESRDKARDARRMSDMRQIVSAQEMYYGDASKYATSAGADIPVVGPYLSVRPEDPQEPNRHYVWLANDWIFGEACKEGGFFCAYATLEIKGNCKKTRYFAASENGYKEVCDVIPAYNRNTGDCTCF